MVAHASAGARVLMCRPLKLVVKPLTSAVLFHGVSTMRIGSIVMHCRKFEEMVEFWGAALGYLPRAPATGGWVVLCDPSGRSPNLSFQARETTARCRSWLHLDLYTNDQEREVARLIGLGAKRYPWRYKPGADYVVLEDPDGNLFCVVLKVDAD